MNLTTELQVDGILSANGGAASTDNHDGKHYSGGGAGGSIYIYTHEFDGSGQVAVSLELYLNFNIFKKTLHNH